MFSEHLCSRVHVLTQIFRNIFISQERNHIKLSFNGQSLYWTRCTFQKFFWSVSPLLCFMDSLRLIHPLFFFYQISTLLFFLRRFALSHLPSLKPLLFRMLFCFILICSSLTLQFLAALQSNIFPWSHSTVFISQNVTRESDQVTFLFLWLWKQLVSWNEIYCMVWGLVCYFFRGFANKSPQLWNRIAILKYLQQSIFKEELFFSCFKVFPTHDL